MIVTIALCTILSSSLMSCYGSFALTKKVYGWNGNVHNPVIKTVAFLGLAIIQVYTVSLFADAIIFNVLEHYSGSNPIAMNNEEKQETIVMVHGKIFKTITSKNKIVFLPLHSKNKRILQYDETNKSWFLMYKNSKTKIANVVGNKLEPLI